LARFWSMTGGRLVRMFVEHVALTLAVTPLFHLFMDDFVRTFAIDTDSTDSAGFTWLQLATPPPKVINHDSRRDDVKEPKKDHHGQVIHLILIASNQATHEILQDIEFEEIGQVPKKNDKKRSR